MAKQTINIILIDLKSIKINRQFCRIVIVYELDMSVSAKLICFQGLIGFEQLILANIY